MDSDGRNQAKPAGIISLEDSLIEDEDDVLDFTDDGAFELYGIHVSGDGDGVCAAREIKIRSNIMGKNKFPSDSIYPPALSPELLREQQNSGNSLTFRGPKYHLTCLYAHEITFIERKSGRENCTIFLDDWDGLDMGMGDKVLTKTISPLCTKSKYTVSYEWITSQARANFRFSFLGQDVSIENLVGSIQVSSLKAGTTRTLGLFHDDCLLSGEALPLLRSSAAFPAGETFTLHFNLSYLLDGSPKEIITSETFCSPSVGKGVCTQKGLDKAKKDPELFTEHVIGDQYPKLQMTVFWLTILFPQSAF